MIKPTEILMLSNDEQAKSVLLEAHIDENIKAASEKDPSLRSFDVSTSAFAKANDGLSIKVRCAVVERYQNAGWKVSFDVKTSKLSFAMPRKYKPRASEPEPAKVDVVADTDAVAA